MRIALVMEDGTRELVEGPASEIVRHCQERPVVEWSVELYSPAHTCQTKAVSLFERGVSASDLVASEAHINATLAAEILLAERHLSETITTGVLRIMSAITDARDKSEANFARIHSGIQALNDQIVALQKSAGSLSAEDQAALAQIVADSNALALAAQLVP